MADGPLDVTETGWTRVAWPTGWPGFFGEPWIVPDARHSGSERRWAAWGRSFEGRELAIVFTLRGDRIRPISARDLSRKERQRYAQAEAKDQDDP
jgi:hypothetical protein